MEHVPLNLVDKLPQALHNPLLDEVVHKGLAQTIAEHAGRAHHAHHAPPRDNGLTCWFLDTRTLWPGEKIATAAARELDLISEAERKAVLGKVFLADARMSLGSALLKRLFVSRTLDIAFRNVKYGRIGDPKHGKPCAADEAGNPVPGIDFNVSHQAGLVTLIGWARARPGRERNRHDSGLALHERFANALPRSLAPAPPPQSVRVGTDIVCVNERDDYRTIDADGFDAWVDIYDAVFSDAERWDMKYNVDSVTLLDGTELSGADLGRADRIVRRNIPLSATGPDGRTLHYTSDVLVAAKLRRFYAFFCYKEAYLKVVGEGLLAPWLTALEFGNVRAPRADCSTLGQWGGVAQDVETLVHGRVQPDVKMQIQGFEQDVMISTAVQGLGEGVQIPPFRQLHLESELRALLGEAV